MLAIELGQARVAIVFRIRRPFQVRGRVVVLVPVLVVDSSSVAGPRTNECLGDQRVHANSPSNRQVHRWVSLLRL